MKHFTMSTRATFALLAGFFSVGIVIGGQFASAQNYETTFDVDSSDIPNPERGWVHSMDWSSTTIPQSFWYTGANASETVTWSVIYVDMNTALPLTGIANHLAYMARNGRKAVLRFAYTTNNNADASDFSIPVNHILSLNSTLRQYPHVIAGINAGFAGPWGEWHDSNLGDLSDPNATPQIIAGYTSIVRAWLSAVPDEVTVYLRRPYFKQRMYNMLTSQAEKRLWDMRVGHNNDCFLASYNDYGTFTEGPDSDPVIYPGDMQPYILGGSLERAYLNNDSTITTSMGQSCPYPVNNDGTPLWNAMKSWRTGCPPVLAELAAQHWALLDLSWYSGMIDTWKPCFGTLARRLGYRLIMLSARVTVADRWVSYNVTITNNGFSPFINRKRVFISLADFEFEVTNDVLHTKLWAAGSTFNVQGGFNATTIPDGNYPVYLTVKDWHYTASNYTNSTYNVRMANLNTWDETMGRNSLRLNALIPSFTVLVAPSSSSSSGLSAASASSSSSTGGTSSAASLQPSLPFAFLCSVILAAALLR